MIVKAILILTVIIILMGIVLYILIRKIKKQSYSIDKLYSETIRLQNQLDRITLEQKIKVEVENDANEKKNKIRTADSDADKFTASLNVLRNN